MVGLLALNLQVAFVVTVGLYLDQDALTDLQPETSQSYHLRQLVRQQTDAPQVQVFQNLSPYPVVPEVRGQLVSITATPGSWRTLASGSLAGIFASFQVHNQPDSVTGFVADYVHLVDHVPDQEQTPASGRLQPF